MKNQKLEAINIVINVMITFGIIFSGVFITLKVYETSLSISDNMFREKEEIESDFIIEKDKEFSDVVQMLEEKNIIDNSFLFKLNTKIFYGDMDVVKKGTYFLSNKMDFKEINRVLSNIDDRNNVITVTIREGLTLKEIGEVLESKGFDSKEEFLKIVNSTKFDKWFLDGEEVRTNYLEGFLFPDTYNFYEGASSESIINRMLNRFSEIYTEDLKIKAKEKELSTREVLTIASIIEKEIRVPEERELASSVIYNRLKQDISLQMCSTVLYVLDVRKEVLSLEDLEVESEYNTYKNKGLPPTPISNAGLASIEAALNPKDTDYLYFVVENEIVGSHYFTNDYTDFLNAKIRYEQEF